MDRRRGGVAFCAAATLAAAAQPPQHVLRGRVVAAITGDPVRNARVHVASGAAAHTQLTDADGRFIIREVSAGDLTITASKPGFAPATLMPNAASAEPIVLVLAKGA